MIQICKTCNSLGKKTILPFFVLICLKFDIAGTMRLSGASDLWYDAEENPLIL